MLEIKWRRVPESNRCTRICNPLRHHSANSPSRCGGCLLGEPARVRKGSGTHLGTHSGFGFVLFSQLLPPLPRFDRPETIRWWTEQVRANHRIAVHVEDWGLGPDQLCDFGGRPTYVLNHFENAHDTLAKEYGHIDKFVPRFRMKSTQDARMRPRMVTLLQSNRPPKDLRNFVRLIALSEEPRQ